jgi:prepilin-type N-terminal cleavage/methylation domain-containing protein
VTEKGYTLIELAVVVSIISLILVFTVPRVRDTILNDSLASITRRLIGTAQELRNNAIRDQVDYIIHFDLNNNTFWTYAADMTPEKIDEQKKDALKFPEGTRMQDICQIGAEKQSDGEATIRFFKTGVIQPTVIHLAKGEKGERSFTIVFQPFLSTIKSYDTYIDISLKKEKNIGNL